MNMSNVEQFRFRSLGKTLVIIDWANVYRWKDSLGWEVDPKGLFDYLSSYQEIGIKYFYCSEGALKKLPADFRQVGFNIQSKEGKFVPVSLEKSYFKKIIKELFDVLDNIKTTNSEIATKLYELREKIESRLADRAPDFDTDGNVQGEYLPYSLEDAKIHGSTYELIEEMDTELKKLNDNIVDLQKHLSQPVMRLKCDFDVEIARDVFNLSNDFEHLILFSGDGDFAALADDLISKGKRVTVVFGGEHLGKEYKVRKGLFLCTVNNLRSEISRQNNIPEDFSSGRDSFIVAKDKQKSQ